MRLRLAAALIAASMTGPVFASSPITAGEFLARAEPVMTKSQISMMFSPEAHQLMGIVRGSAQTLRAQQDADRAAGRRSATCLPPKGRAAIGAAELIDYMRGLTLAQKAQSFDAAFKGFAARKYPCRN